MCSRCVCAHVEAEASLSSCCLCTGQWVSGSAWFHLPQMGLHVCASMYASMYALACPPSFLHQSGGGGLTQILGLPGHALCWPRHLPVQKPNLKGSGLGILSYLLMLPVEQILLVLFWREKFWGLGVGKGQKGWASAEEALCVSPAAEEGFSLGRQQTCCWFYHWAVFTFHVRMADLVGIRKSKQLHFMYFFVC